MAGNLLSCLTVLCTAIGSISCLGYIETNFKEFENFEGKKFDGKCCDNPSFWSWGTSKECTNECDHRFVICMGNGTQSSSMSACEFGHQEVEEVGGNKITFNSHVGKSENPIKFKFGTWPGVVKLKIDVQDEDTGNEFDFVDHYEYQHNTQDLRRKIDAPVESLVLTGTRTRFNLELKVYCEVNYYGRECETYCIETDDDTGHYKCDPVDGDKICKSGWTGIDCLTNIDDCVGNRCSFGSTCVDGLNFYSCACPPGRTGSLCQAEINECASAPCQNGGKCLDASNSFICECASGFAGPVCEVEIDECFSGPCLSGGTCVDKIAAFECNCQAGYSGDRCEIDTDECVSNPCIRAERCIDLPGDYRCDCFPGFTGKNCENDINECISSPCKNGGWCIDETSSFRCICQHGFTGILCEDRLNYCEPNYCQNGATCSSLKETFECHCTQQFTGKTCEDDVDECRSETQLCGDNGICVNTVGDYNCVCNEGYEGQFCEIETDECLTTETACLNDGLCIDLINDFLCDCAGTGFTGSRCEEELDECESSPCENGGSCIDMLNGFVCNCSDGFRGDRCETPTEISSYFVTSTLNDTDLTAREDITSSTLETSSSTVTLPEITTTLGIDEKTSPSPLYNLTIDNVIHVENITTEQTTSGIEIVNKSFISTEQYNFTKHTTYGLDHTIWNMTAYKVPYILKNVTTETQLNHTRMLFSYGINATTVRFRDEINQSTEYPLWKVDLVTTEDSILEQSESKETSTPFDKKTGKTEDYLLPTDTVKPESVWEVNEAEKHRFFEESEEYLSSGLLSEAEEYMSGEGSGLVSSGEITESEEQFSSGEMDEYISSGQIVDKEYSSSGDSKFNVSSAEVNETKQVIFISSGQINETLNLTSSDRDEFYQPSDGVNETEGYLWSVWTVGTAEPEITKADKYVTEAEFIQKEVNASSGEHYEIVSSGEITEEMQYSTTNVTVTDHPSGKSEVVAAKEEYHSSGDITVTVDYISSGKVDEYVSSRDIDDKEEYISSGDEEYTSSGETVDKEQDISSGDQEDVSSGETVDKEDDISSADREDVSSGETIDKEEYISSGDQEYISSRETVDKEEDISSGDQGVSSGDIAEKEEYISSGDQEYESSGDVVAKEEYISSGDRETVSSGETVDKEEYISSGDQQYESSGDVVAKEEYISSGDRETVSSGETVDKEEYISSGDQEYESSGDVVAKEEYISSGDRETVSSGETVDKEEDISSGGQEYESSGDSVAIEEYISSGDRETVSSGETVDKEEDISSGDQEYESSGGIVATEEYISSGDREAVSSGKTVDKEDNISSDDQEYVSSGDIPGEEYHISSGDRETVSSGETVDKEEDISSGDQEIVSSGEVTVTIYQSSRDKKKYVSSGESIEKEKYVSSGEQENESSGEGTYTLTISPRENDMDVPYSSSGDKIWNVETQGIKTSENILYGESGDYLGKSVTEKDFRLSTKQTPFGTSSTFATDETESLESTGESIFWTSSKGQVAGDSAAKFIDYTEFNIVSSGDGEFEEYITEGHVSVKPDFTTIYQTKTYEGVTMELTTGQHENEQMGLTELPDTTVLVFGSGDDKYTLDLTTKESIISQDSVLSSTQEAFSEDQHTVQPMPESKTDVSKAGRLTSSFEDKERIRMNESSSSQFTGFQFTTPSTSSKDQQSSDKYIAGSSVNISSISFTDREFQFTTPDTLTKKSPSSKNLSIQHSTRSNVSTSSSSFKATEFQFSTPSTVTRKSTPSQQSFIQYTSDSHINISSSSFTVTKPSRKTEKTKSSVLSSKPTAVTITDTTMSTISSTKAQDNSIPPLLTTQKRFHISPTTTVETLKTIKAQPVNPWLLAKMHLGRKRQKIRTKVTKAPTLPTSAMVETPIFVISSDKRNISKDNETFYKTSSAFHLPKTDSEIEAEPQITQRMNIESFTKSFPDTVSTAPSQSTEKHLITEMTTGDENTSKGPISTNDIDESTSNTTSVEIISTSSTPIYLTSDIDNTTTYDMFTDVPISDTMHSSTTDHLSSRVVEKVIENTDLMADRVPTTVGKSIFLTSISDQMTTKSFNVSDSRNTTTKSPLSSSIFDKNFEYHTIKVSKGLTDVDRDRSTQNVSTENVSLESVLTQNVSLKNVSSEKVSTISTKNVSTENISYSGFITRMMKQTTRSYDEVHNRTNAHDIRFTLPKKLGKTISLEGLKPTTFSTLIDTKILESPTTSIPCFLTEKCGPIPTIPKLPDFLKANITVTQPDEFIAKGENKDFKSYSSPSYSEQGSTTRLPVQVTSAIDQMSNNTTSATSPSINQVTGQTLIYGNDSKVIKSSSKALISLTSSTLSSSSLFAETSTVAEEKDNIVTELHNTSDSDTKISSAQLSLATATTELPSSSPNIATTTARVDSGKTSEERTNKTNVSQDVTYSNIPRSKIGEVYSTTTLKTTELSQSKEPSTEANKKVKTKSSLPDLLTQTTTRGHTSENDIMRSTRTSVALTQSTPYKDKDDTEPTVARETDGKISDYFTSYSSSPIPLRSSRGNVSTVSSPEVYATSTKVYNYTTVPFQDTTIANQIPHSTTKSKKEIEEELDNRVITSVESTETISTTEKTGDTVSTLLQGIQSSSTKQGVQSSPTAEKLDHVSTPEEIIQSSSTTEKLDNHVATSVESFESSTTTEKLDHVSTPEEIIQSSSTTEKLDYRVATSVESFESSTTTEKLKDRVFTSKQSIQSSSSTENLDDHVATSVESFESSTTTEKQENRVSTSAQSIQSSSTTEKLSNLVGISVERFQSSTKAGKQEDRVSTSENSIQSSSTTENLDDHVATSVESFESSTTTVKLEDRVSTSEQSIQSSSTTEKLNDRFATSVESFTSSTATEKLEDRVLTSEQSIQSSSTTEKLDDRVNISVESFESSTTTGKLEDRVSTSEQIIQSSSTKQSVQLSPTTEKKDAHVALSLESYESSSTTEKLEDRVSISAQSIQSMSTIQSIESISATEKLDNRISTSGQSMQSSSTTESLTDETKIYQTTISSPFYSMPPKEIKSSTPLSVLKEQDENIYTIRPIEETFEKEELSWSDLLKIAIETTTSFITSAIPGEITSANHTSFTQEVAKVTNISYTLNKTIPPEKVGSTTEQTLSFIDDIKTKSTEPIYTTTEFNDLTTRKTLEELQVKSVETTTVPISSSLSSASSKAEPREPYILSATILTYVSKGGKKSDNVSSTTKTTEAMVASSVSPTIKLSKVRHEVDLTAENVYPNPKKEIFEYIRNTTVTRGKATLTFKKIKITVIRGYQEGKRIVLQTYQKVKDITTKVVVTTYRRSRELLEQALQRIEALWQYCKTGIDHYIVKPLLNARVLVKSKFEQTYAQLSEIFYRGKEILKMTTDNVREDVSTYFDSLTKYYTDVYRQYSTEVRDIFESLKIPDS